MKLIFLCLLVLIVNTLALVRNPIVKSLSKGSNSKLKDTTTTAIESLSFVTSYLQKVSSDQARTGIYL